MSITEKERVEMTQALKQQPAEKIMLWDDANERCFTAHQLLEGLSGSLAPALPQQMTPPIARDPELGDLTMRPEQPTPGMRIAGADFLRLIRGDACLDLGDQKTLEDLAEDLYKTMCKHYEFRHVIIATVAIERKEI